jgi:hypothetical protein
MRILPAAAVPKDSVVRLGEPGEEHRFIIARVENSTPRAGLITWIDPDGLEEVVGGNDKIEIVELPS